MLTLTNAPDRYWPVPPSDLSLSSDETHVWRSSLDLSPVHVDSCWRVLATDERRRAERYYFEKDRNRFIVGRGLLRAILSRYLGVEPRLLRFCYNAYGKPCLAGAPGAEWLCFNVAHSDGLALYAVTRGRAIGVDLEYLRADLAGEQLAERFYAPGEIAALRALPACLRQTAFFNAWTRKEAYLKAEGRGLSIGLDQVEVTLAPGEPAELLSITSDRQAAADWSLLAFTPGPNYVAALAVKGHGWRLKCWQWPDSSPLSSVSEFSSIRQTCIPARR